MANLGEAARAAALSLIGQVQDGRLMTELLPQALEQLPEGDRARAQRLAMTTLRWMGRADRMLGPYLQKRPEDQVLNILRLGVVEMCVDKAAPHGVLNALVNLSKSANETKRASGLVNAVLRRVSETVETWDGLATPRLPKPMRKVLNATYGKAALEAMEAAHANGAPLDLSAKRDAAAVAKAVDGELLPNNSIRLSARVKVSALPGFAEGDWWVQDAAAAFPAQILKPKAGEKILDMCAAPGGKTLQIAAKGADVTALDVGEHRMVRVRENLERMGLSAEMVVADALEYKPEVSYDAILLDAPCTATGTIRRHPDLPPAKSGGDFSDLFALQSKLIDKALAWLRPGGRLVYCTCSLYVEEGEQQIESALNRHKRLRIDLPGLQIPGIEREWIGKQGVRLRPDFWADRGGMDGFFITMLRLPS